ncbi:hypothetical protein RRG08_045298 [Elysia crispata]|uniref:Bile salt export pump n=1 Tax=Elysia crispata TaxID=231223 RepID=A0AAE1DR08_9GAST|nr:hypothetical protein RRG08_045298 [Elysia crispata]
MVLIYVAVFCSVIHGVSYPAMVVLFAKAIELFVNHGKFDRLLDRVPEFLYFYNMSKSETRKHLDDFEQHCPALERFYKSERLSCEVLDDDFDDTFEDMDQISLQFIVGGFIVICAAFGQIFLFILTSERQILRMRLAFYKNIMRQEMGWFDSNNSGEMNVKLTDDIGRIHDAIGDKLGTAIQYFSGSIFGWTVIFYYGWELALVMQIGAPFLIISFAWMGVVFTNMTTLERKAYAQAGNVAKEVFSSIRTVQAFNGQEKEAVRYEKSLFDAKKYGIKKSMASGLGQGASWGIILSTWGLGFWYGGKLVRDDDYEVHEMMATTRSLSTTHGLCPCLHNTISVYTTRSLSLSTPHGLCLCLYFTISVYNTRSLSTPHGLCLCLHYTISVYNTRSLSTTHGLCLQHTVSVYTTRSLSLSTLHDLCLQHTVSVSVYTTRSLSTTHGLCLHHTVSVSVYNTRSMSTTHGLCLHYTVSVSVYTTRSLSTTHGLCLQHTVSVYTTRSLSTPHGLCLCLHYTISVSVYNTRSMTLSAPHGLCLHNTVSVYTTRSLSLSTPHGLCLHHKIYVSVCTTRSLSTPHDLCLSLHHTVSVSVYTTRSLFTPQDLCLCLHHTVSVYTTRSMSLSTPHGLCLCPHHTVSVYTTRSMSLSTPHGLCLHHKIYVSVYTTRSLSTPHDLCLCLHHTVSVSVYTTRSLFTPQDLCLCLHHTVSVYTTRSMSLSTPHGLCLHHTVSVYTTRSMSLSTPHGLCLHHTVSVYTTRSMSLSTPHGLCLHHKIYVSVYTTRSLSLSTPHGLCLHHKIYVSVYTTRSLSLSTPHGLCLHHKIYVSVYTTRSLSTPHGLCLCLHHTVSVYTTRSMSLSTPHGLCLHHKVYASVYTTRSLSTPHGLYLNCTVSVYTTRSMSLSTPHGLCLHHTSTLNGLALPALTRFFHVPSHQVFITALVGCQCFGLALPAVLTVNTGRAAAYGVFQILDRKSKIDSFSEEGLQPQTLTGNISLKGVHFTYPSREDVKILNGLDLTVPAGKTVALVGQSGCGKSTVVQLLQRFYDPDAGQVCLDGVDLRDINIKWLRQHIGIVGQEPVLFATSIAENIRHGREGATMDEVIAACRSANAYDFIMKMPDGFDTHVGERGAQLSGGQKQRIAIARALVKNPKILLLDEATSALDTESESIVQDALDKASRGRTTLVIAHRLSTIISADAIIVFNKGQVAERGTHAQLMARGGLYYELVSSQSVEHISPLISQWSTSPLSSVSGAHLPSHQSVEHISPLISQLCTLSPLISQWSTSPLSSVSGAHLPSHQSVVHIFPLIISCVPSPLSSVSGVPSPLSSVSGVPSPLSSVIGVPSPLPSVSGVPSPLSSASHGRVSLAENMPVAPKTWSRIFKLNRPEWCYIFVGCVAAFLNGAVQPSWSLILAEAIEAFAHEDKGHQKDKMRDLSLLSLGIGLSNFFSYFFQEHMFGLSGENLTMRVRGLLFRAMARQNIGWFDDPDHETGVLSSQLAVEASTVQGTVKTSLCYAILCVGNIGTGVVISFICSWRLAFATCGFIPIIIFG